MATINPKLEFYRFKLNHKKEEFKTFNDFVLEELGGIPPLTNKESMKLLFEHFIKSLDGNFAKDKELLKKIALVKEEDVNKYLEYQPKFSTKSNIISGVINGGSYGRDGIIYDTEDDNSSSLGAQKSILQYYFFLLYLPLDHNEGCFIINSNSKDESITVMFRNYIAKLFKKSGYNKARVEAFCPKSFQDEFRKGAILQNITFQTTFVENTHADKVIQDFFNQYDIKIEAKPKNKNISISSVSEIRSILNKKIFGNSNSTKKLDNFEDNKMTVKNPVNNSTKTFQWNSKDNNFVPVVYLKDYIKKKNEDGTLDFVELKKFCNTIFKDEILPEIRPDLNVS